MLTAAIQEFPAVCCLLSISRRRRICTRFRDNLPLPPRFYQVEAPLALLPFGVDFLALAAQLEMPCDQPAGHPIGPYYASIAEIYERLRDGFVTLGSPGAPTAATLFLGPNAPQLDNAAFGAAPGQLWYDITLLRVTDLASALATIDLIRVQGEGATPDLLAQPVVLGVKVDTTSHYARVLDFLGLPPLAMADFAVVNASESVRSAGLERLARRPPGWLRALYRPVQPFLVRAQLNPTTLLGRLNWSRRPKGALRSEFRAELERYFAADVAELEQLLGRSLWFHGSSSQPFPPAAD